jgi:RNA polymerase sigma-70 factor (ECF subfamily)
MILVKVSEFLLRFAITSGHLQTLTDATTLNMKEHQTFSILLGQAKSGDREAFDALSQPYRERLLAFARSRIGHSLRGRLDPEDIVQETLLKSFGSIGKFRGDNSNSLWSWFSGIAEHLIWNASRKRTLREASLPLEAPDDRISPSRGLRRKERLARLEQSLESLSPDQRHVVVFSKIDGLNSKEIAERMGRSEDAVRQLLSRGLRALRGKFGDTESLHLPHRSLDEGAGDESK